MKKVLGLAICFMFLFSCTNTAVKHSFAIGKWNCPNLDCIEITKTTTNFTMTSGITQKYRITYADEKIVKSSGDKCDYEFKKTDNADKLILNQIIGSVVQSLEITRR